MTDKAKDAEELAEGTLLSHLIELRSRLVKMAAAVIGLFAVLLPFNQRIFELVSKPLLAAVPSGQMIITGAAAPLLVPFKLTFLVALFLAIPVVLYQLWAFVAPGLYRKEKRFALPLLASSILLFYAGVAFAYYVVFPLIFGFFGSINIEGAPWTPDIGSYLDFITSIVLAFGVAFEVPIATVLVVWAGLTTPEKLGKARPYVFLGCFVIGMFLTPPDVISQTLLAIPVYLLYEGGVVMSRLFTRKPEEAETVTVE
ncbi:MAG TPA: twin-arginine translocase subunit TatC [Woeseiaceae bacterium]|jgi:sec-independent protein translocase protein TatC|nr:twin-arginine translocase subunit TatC [Woeseiaceae bacterium]